MIQQIAVVHYSRGLAASQMTPRQAADVFAREHWPDGRRVLRHWLVEGLPLACEFVLTGGRRVYRASWQDGPQNGPLTGQGRYVIDVVGERGA